MATSHAAHFLPSEGDEVATQVRQEVRLDDLTGNPRDVNGAEETSQSQLRVHLVDHCFQRFVGRVGRPGVEGTGIVCPAVAAQVADCAEAVLDDFNL